MLHLVYVSSAQELLTDEQILDILHVSRRNNERDGITGLLLYKGGNFIQALEGPAERVEALLERIEHDPRHKGMELLIREQHPERSFPNWSMGFYNLDMLSDEERLHASDFLDVGSLPAALQADRRRVRILLETFRKVVQ